MTNSKPLQGLSDRYEVLELLGEGGMGRVYKALDLTLKRTVAIKVLSGRLAELNVPRFQREAQTMSALKHANLVEVYDFGVTDSGDTFLVMEYVTGKTLSSVIKERAPMDVADVLELSQSIATGMAHAHAKNVVHRDLKPSNVVVMHSDDLSGLKILDFGISKALDSSKDRDFLTRTGDMIGTPLYMSPEQASGSQVDQRADIYSLGCIIYECLSGKVPFIGDTALDTIRMHRFDPPPSLNKTRPDLAIPERLNSFVLQLLAKAPSERPPTMNAVIEELELIEQELVVNVPLKPAADALQHNIASTNSGRNNNKLFVGLVGFAVVILGLIGTLLFSYSTSTRSSPYAVAPATVEPEGQSSSPESWQNYFVGTTDDKYSVVLDSFTDKNPEYSVPGVSIDRKPLLTAKQIDLLPKKKVKTLRVVFSRLTGDSIGALSKLPLLEDLYLKETNRDSHELGQISKLTKLTALRMDNMNVSADTLREWKALKGLRTLVMDTCSITGDIIPATAETFPNLQELDLSGCWGVNVKSLDAVAKMKHLIYLSLGGINISDQDLARMKGTKQLHRLNLRANKSVTPSGVRMVLLQNPKLRSLDIDECPNLYQEVIDKVGIRGIEYSNMRPHREVTTRGAEKYKIGLDQFKELY